MPRLLIVKTTSLGDVIHNLPVINDIRAHLPETRIDWVVEESFADIPRLHPGIDKVLTVAMRRWRKHALSAATWREISAVRHQIKLHEYDFILDTQGLLKSALICRMANGTRHGYGMKSAREPLAASLYDVTHDVAKDQHAVVRIRQLAAQAPDYGIQTGTNGIGIELPGAYVVGMHGTSRDSKLWSEEHWIALAQHLHGRGLAMVLPWGSQSEYERATRIAVHTPQTIVLPRMGLHALTSVIASAQAAIGVDTGLMHLAVALKKPSVAIYTDTDPALTGIYPGENTIAINMGGKNQLPAVADVCDCLAAHRVI